MTESQENNLEPCKHQVRECTECGGIYRTECGENSEHKQISELRARIAELEIKNQTLKITHRMIAYEIERQKNKELEQKIAELEKEKAAYREVAIGISARNLGSIELKQNDRVKDCWNEAQSIIDAEAKRILEEKK